MTAHRSGFVNIVGRPNVGKSTLLNALMGEQMSIVTNKPQTTRHRIFGILSGEDFQVIFSDTPGMIHQPRYRMQQHMNRFVEGTFEDADLFLFVVNAGEQYDTADPLFNKFRKAEAPVLLVINKADLLTPAETDKAVETWRTLYPFTEVLAVSAREKTGTEELLQNILERIPEGPEYYPKDQLSDKSERFFASEIIREKIFLLYQEEIPYSCEVVIESFKEDTERVPPLLRIMATIYVDRKTQKSILIGKGGAKIKELGTDARLHLESFFGYKVFLELHVKVKENWRDDDRSLQFFGYDHV